MEDNTPFLLKMLHGLHELGEYMQDDDVLNTFLDYVGQLSLEPYQI